MNKKLFKATVQTKLVDDKCFEKFTESTLTFVADSITDVHDYIMGPESSFSSYSRLEQLGNDNQVILVPDKDETNAS